MGNYFAKPFKTKDQNEFLKIVKSKKFKNPKDMKNLIFAASTLIIMLIICESVSAQSYPRMRILFENGITVVGKKGFMHQEEVRMDVSGSPIRYPYDDIIRIETKQGRAGKYALGFGGGCLALGLLVTAINTDDEFDTGELILGSILWAAIFAGVGAGVGALTDPWRTVYSGKRDSVFDRLDLSLTSNKHAPFIIGVVYKL